MYFKGGGIRGRTFGSEEKGRGSLSKWLGKELPINLQLLKVGSQDA